MALVVGFQCGRPDVIAAPPDLHIVLAKALGRLPFVQTLQRAVVPFVEPPAAPDGYPGPVHLDQREVCGLDGAHQDRRVDDGWGKAGSLHQPSRLLGLGDPKLAQRHIVPAGEEVFEVPRTLPVPEEDEGSDLSSDGRKPLPSPPRSWRTPPR